MATSTVDKTAVVAILRRISEGLRYVFDQAHEEECMRDDLGDSEPPADGTVSQRLGIQVDELDELIGALEEAQSVVTAEPEEIKMMMALHNEIKNAETYVVSALEEPNLSAQVVGCLGNARGILAGAAAWIENVGNTPAEAPALQRNDRTETSE